MKRIPLLVMAGLFAYSGLVPDAAAQDNAEEPALATPQEAARHEVPEEPTLLHATQMMQLADNQALAIATLTQVPEVEALSVDELPAEEAADDIVGMSVDEYVTRYRERIGLLRYAMAANTEVRDALEDADVDLSNVVAAEIRPDMALRVYTWNQ